MQQISLGLLKIETKMIANFSTELFSNSYQQQRNPPDDPPPPPVSPSVCCSYSSTKHIPLLPYCRYLSLLPYKSPMAKMIL